MSSLMETAAQLTRWIVSIVLILGILSNIFNIIILRRRNLKQYSCTLYFLTLSINNLVYVSVCVTFNLLADGFGISLTTRSEVFCRLNTYVLNLCPQILVFMLVLASIDRYLSSSIHVHLRRLSNLRNTQLSILIALVVSAIFILGSAIMVDTYTDPMGRCMTNTNSLFSQILRISQVIVFVMIGPFFMIVFGLLTIKNTDYTHRLNIVALRYRRNERQLTRMLIVQVSTHIFLSIPFCVMFFMSILPITFKSSLMFYFLFIIFKIPLYVTFVTPFFLYILTGQLYRTEFILLLKRIVRTRTNVAIHPIRTLVNTTKNVNTNKGLISQS